MGPFRWILIACLAVLTPFSAFALPGEAAAVIRHCGEPHAERFATSEVTNKPQRDLIYNAVILHFEPLEGGWSFTTAWKGHFPMTRGELEKSLPCFRAAMQEVAAAPQPVIDPTIAGQTLATAPMSASTFGIPHLWLIVVLVVATLIIVLLPRRRKEPVNRIVENRPYRKPSLQSRIWRRRRPILPRE